MVRLTDRLDIAVEWDVEIAINCLRNSPTPGHGPWGQKLWHESRPLRVPILQINMKGCRNIYLRNAKLCCKFPQMDEKEPTERRKLYTPLHKCQGYK